jgi:uncharacterized protein (TIGR02284 family)
MVPDAPSDRAAVVQALQRLIATCRESEETYRDAARATSAKEQRSFYVLCSQQRAAFGAALVVELERVAGVTTPWEPRSASGDRARAPADDEAIWEGCRRHEDRAVRGYEAALEADLPEDIDMLLRQQEAMVRATHDRLRVLGARPESATAEAGRLRDAVPRT